VGETKIGGEPCTHKAFAMRFTTFCHTKCGFVQELARLILMTVIVACFIESQDPSSSLPA
jgi:hypothetical protein